MRKFSSFLSINSIPNYEKYTKVSYVCCEIDATLDMSHYTLSHSEYMDTGLYMSNSRHHYMTSYPVTTDIFYYII